LKVPEIRRLIALPGPVSPALIHYQPYPPTSAELTSACGCASAWTWKTAPRA